MELALSRAQQLPPLRLAEIPAETVRPSQEGWPC